MDRGAWQATVHWVAKSRTRLSDFTFFGFYQPGPSIHPPPNCDNQNCLKTYPMPLRGSNTLSCPC